MFILWILAIMKIGSKDSKPKEKTTSLQGPTATNTKSSKGEEAAVLAHKNKERKRQDLHNEMQTNALGMAADNANANENDNDNENDNANYDEDGNVD